MCALYSTEQMAGTVVTTLHCELWQLLTFTNLKGHIDVSVNGRRLRVASNLFKQVQCFSCY